MKKSTKYLSGSLTLFSVDRTVIVGELIDASWVEEAGDAGVNYILSGQASDGTVDTIQQLTNSGVDTVAYDFGADSRLYQGTAMVLRPQGTKLPGSTEISIETPEPPRLTDTVAGARYQVL